MCCFPWAFYLIPLIYTQAPSPIPHYLHYFSLCSKSQSDSCVLQHCFSVLYWLFCFFVFLYVFYSVSLSAKGVYLHIEFYNPKLSKESLKKNVQSWRTNFLDLKYITTWLWSKQFGAGMRMTQWTHKIKWRTHKPYINGQWISTGTIQGGKNSPLSRYCWESSMSTISMVSWTPV